MIFLTSPNNPDGSMISEESLVRILRLPALVILDEAYIEFSKVGSPFMPSILLPLTTGLEFKLKDLADDVLSIFHRR